MGSFNSFNQPAFAPAPAAHFTVNNNQQFASFPMYPAVGQPFQANNPIVPQPTAAFNTTGHGFTQPAMVNCASIANFQPNLS
jgi:hypothetical protein